MPRLIITIILLFGSLVIGFGYLRPAWQEFKNLGQETRNLEAISAELDLLIENRDALIKKINAISPSDLGRINSAVPRSPQAAKFLVNLENLTLSQGMIITSVDLVSPSGEKREQTQQSPGLQPQPGGIIPTPERAKSELLEFPVGLKLSGSYESFKKFLGELEKNLRITDVLEMGFAAPTQTQTNAKTNAQPNTVMDFRMKIKTYYQ